MFNNKRIFLILIFIFSATISGFSTRVELIGTVGGKSVEMVMEESNYSSGDIRGYCYHGEYFGKYFNSHGKRYNIEGKNYGTVIYIEEFYDKILSGKYFLEKNGNFLNGWWVIEQECLVVELEIVNDERDFFELMSINEHSLNTNKVISGVYMIKNYFINDYNFTHEKQDYKISLNGGVANIVDIDDGKIRFELVVVCGMDCHKASVSGIAIKQDKTYVYKSDTVDEKSCEISFKFKNRSVLIKSQNVLNCGFDDQIYVDHKLIKVRNLH